MHAADAAAARPVGCGGGTATRLAVHKDATGAAQRKNRTDKRDNKNMDDMTSNNLSNRKTTQHAAAWQISKKN